MTKFIRGDPDRTYTLPETVTIVREFAFQKTKFKDNPVHIRLNKRLEILEDYCFYCSTITRLILPPNVKHIGLYAFTKCDQLEHADLSAARGLKSIGECVFYSCKSLK